MAYKRMLIIWLDFHGKRYSISRKISVNRMISMGI